MSCKEGWAWLWNSQKWHYFRGGRSLCGKFLLLAHPEEGYEIGNDLSKDNCAICRKKRLREKQKLLKESTKD